jgi:hypothetical protein
MSIFPHLREIADNDQGFALFSLLLARFPRFACTVVQGLFTHPAESQMGCTSNWNPLD